MNSGCFDSDISKVVHSISVINVKTSLEKEITKDEIDFFTEVQAYQKHLLLPL